jgi:hypothetical protein
LCTKPFLTFSSWFIINPMPLKNKTVLITGADDFIGSHMGTSALNRVIEDFELLPIDDKEYAFAIFTKQLIEAKREAIAKRTKEAVTNLRKGAIQKGTIKDLMKDLVGSHEEVY